MENDRVNLATNLVKAVVKAKKLLQIYPANNIIYLNALGETYGFMQDYFKSYGDLILSIKPAEILVDSEQAYRSSDKIDNIALFFFKEGIRELTFRQGLTQAEFEGFLKLLGMDFDKGDVSEDFIASVWEQGFENIRFTIDDVFLLEGDASVGGLPGLRSGEPEVQDTDASSLEGKAPGLGTLFLSEGDATGSVSAGEGEVAGPYSRGQENSMLLNAYKDSLSKEEVLAVKAGELTTEERGLIISEMSKEPAEKSWQLAEILMTMLAKASNGEEAGKTAKSLKELILYSLRGNDLGTALITLRGIKEMPPDRRDAPGTGEQVEYLLSFCRSPDVMAQIGRMLDSTKEINEEDLSEYAWHLGKESLGPFMSLLEHLQNISARRMVNNILIHLGKENIEALLARLKDPTWYVVRNIVYVLRNIGDNAVLDDILRMAHHEHPRVRLEVLKALNDFKSVKALQALKEFFNDSDSTVRLSAITVIGTMAKEHSGARFFARDAILEKIREKGFEDRDFREKKSFYEALASFKDREMQVHMIQALKKRSLFGSRKNAETRACAAYYLGLAGSRDALPLLEILQKSSEPLLREHATEAVQRIKHE